MVARPPVRIRIEPMRLEDLPLVHAIERASFNAPWPANAYRSELESNRMAHYLVARADGDIVAYGGMWLMVDEAHITTFAVHPDWRRQRIGERLLLAFLDMAVDRGAREATLEVRLSNLPARRLYEKYGFRPVGLRPRYYSDDNEDALIMTTEALSDAGQQARIGPAARRARRVAGTGAAGCRPRRRRGMSGPLVLAHRIVVRRDRDRPDRGRPDDPRQRRRVAGRAPRGDGRDRARGRRRAHLRWIIPVLDEAWSDAGVVVDRRRRRGRHVRSRVSRARCSSASTSRRRWRGSTTARSSGSTTSRATSTRPGWPIPTRRTRPSRSSRSSPSSSRAGTRSSSR